MRKKTGFSLLLPLLAVATAIPAAEPESGLYSVTVNVSGEFLASGDIEKSYEQCATAEVLSADPASILGNHVGLEGCTVTQYEWGGGKISMQMECALEGAEASAESRGTYDASLWEVLTIVKIKIGDTVLKAESLARGERIGDC